MDPRKLKLMLLSFQGYRNKADEGDDLEGDTTTEDKPDEEDRGDDFSPDMDVPEAKEPAKKEEPKAEEEQSEEEEKPESKGSAHIPKARFDEVLTQRNAERERAAAQEARAAELERQLAAFQQQTTKPPESKPEPVDINKLETEYANLMMAGDVADAVKLRGQINEAIRIEAEAAAERRMEAREQAREHKAMASELQRESAAILEAYAYLDTPDGEVALDLIVAQRDRYMAQGIPAAQALRKAADLIAPKFAPDDGEKPEPKADTTELKEDTRKKAAIQRGIKDSELQPPNMTGVGNRAMETINRDVSKMSEEEFEALPESVKAKMRGD